jgi:hypothetical protein
MGRGAKLLILAGGFDEEYAITAGKYALHEFMTQNKSWTNLEVVGLMELSNCPRAGSTRVLLYREGHNVYDGEWHVYSGLPICAFTAPAKKVRPGAKLDTP